MEKNIFKSFRYKSDFLRFFESFPDFFLCRIWLNWRALVEWHIPNVDKQRGIIYVFFMNFFSSEIMNFLKKKKVFFFRWETYFLRTLSWLTHINLSKKGIFFWLFGTKGSLKQKYCFFPVFSQDPDSCESWLCSCTRHRACTFSNHCANICSTLWDSHRGAVLQSLIYIS